MRLGARDGNEIEPTSLPRTGRLLQAGDRQPSDDGASLSIEHAPRREDIFIGETF
jgi:hypothetical protein